ncbi:hypothetical protein, partial [Salmonella enterica]|uniref:hypothetical protein n=1 Tax=Salmonella enterica TaxID=28901 RepID=UPI0030ABC2E3
QIYIPCDATALALDADAVATAIAREANLRKVNIQIIRNGSRGMLWLEPLVEVATSQGRMAYGPVSETDVASLFDANFHLATSNKAHPLAQGPTEA